jgi:phosphoribosylanthranilate isomerase
MRTRVKICCISSSAEAQLAIQSGADAVGFVAQRPPSPRTIADEAIARIAQMIPPPVSTFLLTSEISAEAISAHIRSTNPTAVQLLAHLDPVESAKLAKLEPQVRRVQVIHVHGIEALELISMYAPFVHAFLLDSGKPNLATPQFGGTGRPHDWTVSAKFVEKCPLPVFLAGGLSTSNVGEAVVRVRPFGLDLCTGVRTDGRLDRDKLTQFMSAVRHADSYAARSTG